MKTERKKKLKGFTLVELVVVIAVFGLLIAATLSFLTPTNRVMKSTSQYAHASGIVDNVRRVVEDELRYANRMHVYAGPDTSGDESAFMKKAVDDLREEFLLGTTAQQRVTHGLDRVYVMKINNPEESQFGSGFTAADEKPGKVSVWRYDAGSLNSSESKEWAIAEANYVDYSFSLSFGTEFKTEEVNIAGTSKNHIVEGKYTSFDGIKTPDNFHMVLNIYENNYANRADKAGSAYTLFDTSVTNVVALSFVNMISGATVKKEVIDFIEHPTDPAVTSYPDVKEANRYDFKSVPAVGSTSRDLYFVYTLPELK